MIQLGDSHLPAAAAIGNFNNTPSEGRLEWNSVESERGSRKISAVFHRVTLCSDFLRLCYANATRWNSHGIYGILKAIN